MEASRELAQMDTAKTNKELIRLQQKQITIENRYLDKIDASTEELRQIKSMFAAYALKSYEQLEQINRGLGDIKLGLDVLNESIQKSTERIVDKLELFQQELLELLKNRRMTDADALRRLGKQRFGATINSDGENQRDLEEAIEFYENSVNDFVGKTNPLSWLELGHTYAYKEDFNRAKTAYLQADRLSNQGHRIILEIRNEALFNLVLIEISEENFQNAYEYIQRIVNSDTDHDISIFLLKGLVEMKMGLPVDSFLNIQKALYNRPELIRDLYTYGSEGILINHNDRVSLVKRLCNSLKSEIEVKYKWVNNNLPEYNPIISSHGESTTTQIPRKLFDLFKEVGQIEPYDFLGLLSIYNKFNYEYVNFKKELRRALEAAIKSEDYNLQIAESKVENYGSTESRAHQSLQNDVDSFNSKSQIGAFIGFIVLMIVLDSRWYWRIILAGIILLILYVIAYGFFNNYYNQEWEENKIMHENELESYQQDLNNVRIRRNHLSKLMEKLNKTDSNEKGLILT
ncbi:tetratricopeptide repeat protein [Flagellimonas meridianipacifica]|uniref:Tetratricopeptide repeat protein n=2 Tax=Flagellimonas meridianipacifica TaxID=1080225 RepID=A0A2T0MAB0_9FLAO|nr:tetratricopeptide repeat protein [Allomuricauda pacifica]